MNPYEMVAVVVLLVTVGGFIQLRSRHQTVNATIAGQDIATLAQEVHQLKERIQVLERVITDNHSSVDLASEIERLRNR